MKESNSCPLRPSTPSTPWRPILAMWSHPTPACLFQAHHCDMFRKLVSEEGNQGVGTKRLQPKELEPKRLRTWMRALMQQLRQSLLHFSTVTNRLPPADIGTSVWSQTTCSVAFESVTAPRQRQSGEAGCILAARGQTRACSLTATPNKSQQVRRLKGGVRPSRFRV